jgi:NTP pyrophosphatase (non-canonical NTP hydrolase)
MSDRSLTFDDYQHRATLTDKLPAADEDRLVLPLLGLVGEVGALATEWKKRRRDSTGYHAFTDQLREELGDALWYMAILAERAGLQLSDLAQANLDKVSDLFGAGETLQHHYDDESPEGERLPRELSVSFRETGVVRGDRRVPGIQVEVLGTGIVIGDALDDNSDVEDDYRYHDALHLAHMAVLGWSPVMRATLRPKRKRRGGRADRVEDGGRAIAIEEGLTAAVFAEARSHSYFATADRVPGALIKSCRAMTSHLEVADRSAGDWQRAILTGYRAFNYLVTNREGVVIADMEARTLTCEPLPRP